MIHQLSTFTAPSTVVQYAFAVYRYHPGHGYVVATSNTGPDRDRVEAYAVGQALAHPDWIVWMVTRELVTPAWVPA